MADQNDEVVVADEMLSRLLPKSVLEEEEEEEVCDQIKVKPAPVVYLSHRHQPPPPKRAHSTSPPPPSTEGARLHHDHLVRFQRPRNVTNTKASFGGPGTQAVFLDFGKPRTGGTGVFLPRPAGTQFPLSNKPARPPILLPARVVNALNLNVHELGGLKQLKQPPRQEYGGGKKSKSATGGGGGGGVDYLNGKKNNIGGATSGAGQWCAAPGIFLPNEWTY